MPEITSEFMTVKDVAEFFEVKPETVRDWIKQSKFPAAKLPDGSYRVQRAHVNEWAQSLYGSN